MSTQIHIIFSLDLLLFQAYVQCVSGLFSSGVGVGIAFIMLGSYVTKNDKANMYPIVILSVYVLFASIGYYTIPLLMMSEVFPIQVGMLATFFVTLDVLDFMPVKLLCILLYS